MTEPEALAHEVEELEAKSASAARLFDIRLIIGSLFVVYGIIVTATGINPSDEELEKAQDININLWTGLSMLLLGLLFLLWQWLRPVVPPSAEEIAAAMDRPDAH
ncbi:hypothetical protein AB0M28_39795 [Streptomyces sp. NPDC051940]|uniref:hypothetical protein n=1 Tax=Streptomyces sp. NPDC051940 TaxID=3155675 RepID=UPI00342BA45B